MLLLKIHASCELTTLIPSRLFIILLLEIFTLSALSKRIPTDPQEISKFDILTLSDLTVITGDAEFPLKIDFTILIMFNDLFTVRETSSYLFPAKINESPEFARSMIFWISLPDRLSLINVPTFFET